MGHSVHTDMPVRSFELSKTVPPSDPEAHTDIYFSINPSLDRPGVVKFERFQ
jgi:hypothetical protein